MTQSYQRLEQVRAAHRANLLKSLEYRLEVARAKGDENLVRALQAERAYYERR
ncbi:MAG: hypothetical protein ACFB4I_23365 [Cyanophyceae cyanobacterium]